MIITNDFGLSLKCQGRSIKCEMILQKYLVPFKEDPKDIELVKTKKELEIYKNRLPEFRLLINQQNYKIDVGEFPSTLISKRTWINENFQEIEKEYPLLDDEGFPNYKSESLKQRNSIKFRSAAIPKFMQPSFDSIREYNKEVDNYHEKCKLYLSRNYDVIRATLHSIPINILIENVGSSPANNVDIIVQVSSPYELKADELLKEIIEIPKGPDRPAGMLGSTLKPWFAKESYFDVDISSFLEENSNIKQLKDNVIQIHCGKIKHNTRLEAPKLYLVGDNYEKLKSVKVQVTISCDDLIKNEENTFLIKEN